MNKNDNIHKNEVQNIGFGIPIELLSQRKKILQIGPETTKLDCCGQDSHLGKVRYRILNPNQNSKPKKKKYSNRSRNNEIGLLWSGQAFGESTLSNLESQSKFQVKEEEKILKSDQKQRNWTVVVRTVIFGKYNIEY